MKQFLQAFIVFILSSQLVAPVLADDALSTVKTAAENKPVIGVLKFQDETGAMFLQGGVGRALTTMLTNELSARPTLTIVERQKLRAVLEEQKPAAILEIFLVGMRQGFVTGFSPYRRS